jgi:hypothetical protein
MTDDKDVVPLAPTPDPTSISPEAAPERDPQTGQAKSDPSLTEGDPSQLSDGGANSSRHTGDNARQ